MVKKISSLGKVNWLVARITAIFVLISIITITVFWLFITDGSYNSWHEFFKADAIKFINVIAIIGIVVHAWIGAWTVITDYVHHKIWSFILELIVAVLLLVSFTWCLFIMGF